MGGSVSDLTAGATPSEGSTPVSTVATDDLFEVLSNRRRRYVLHYLKGRKDGEHVEIGTLAERIAAWENGIEITQVSGPQRKRVYTALQQSHLPKMDAAGVLSFRKDRGLVEAASAIEEFDIYVDLVSNTDIPWSEYYLALSAVCGALLAAVWLGAYPFAAVSPLNWAAIVVSLFWLSSLGHLYYTRSRSLGRGEYPPEIDRR